MKLLKFITPFILCFPVAIVLAFKTWKGDFEYVSLAPARSVLFVAIGFTMLISDLFLKYLIGKNKVRYVWIIEVIILVILCMMIIPRINAERLV